MRVTASFFFILTLTALTLSSSSKELKGNTLLYNSWVSKKCDISGNLPNKIIESTSSNFNLKSKFTFRYEESVYLVVIIDCYNTPKPVYLLKVHFEMFNKETSAREYVGNVYVDHSHSYIEPVYFYKSKLIEKLRIAVDEAVIDFLKSKKPPSYNDGSEK
jgi:hypothetical protein